MRREAKSATKTPRTARRTRGFEPCKPCQYIRGQGDMANRRRRSGGLQIICRGLSGPPIGDNLIRDLLSLAEAAHPGALDGADVHENILAAVIRLDEAKAFLVVEPLYGSLRHETLLSGTCLASRALARSQPIVIEILEEGRQSRR